MRRAAETTNTTTSYLVAVALVLLLGATGTGVLEGQQSFTPYPTEDVQFQAPAPVAPVLSANYSGPAGQQRLTYWVVATYPRGQSPASNAVRVQVLSTPTAADPVTLSWNRPTGATSFSVLRSTTATFPSPCTCLVGTTATGQLDDTGAALSAFTHSAVGGATGVVRLDNSGFAATNFTFNRAFVVTPYATASATDNFLRVGSDGTVSVGAAGGVTPAAPDEAIQFRVDASTLGGDADLLWDAATNAMTVASDMRLHTASSSGLRFIPAAGFVDETTLLENEGLVALRVAETNNATGEVGACFGRGCTVTSNVIQMRIDSPITIFRVVTPSGTQGTNRAFEFERTGLPVAGFTANGGYLAPLTTVAFSATPDFDLNVGYTFKITLTGNVTSSTFSNIPAVTFSQEVRMIICQDGVGSHTFVFPTEARGEGTIGAGLSTCSTQVFVSDGTDLFAVSTMQTGI